MVNSNWFVKNSLYYANKKSISVFSKQGEQSKVFSPVLRVSDTLKYFNYERKKET